MSCVVHAHPDHRCGGTETQCAECPVRALGEKRYSGKQMLLGAFRDRADVGVQAAYAHAQTMKEYWPPNGIPLELIPLYAGTLKAGQELEDHLTALGAAINLRAGRQA